MARWSLGQTQAAASSRWWTAYAEAARRAVLANSTGHRMLVPDP
jgi:hypothetical protein